MWLSNAPKITSSLEDLTPKHEMPQATKDYLKEITSEAFAETIEKKYEEDSKFAKGVDGIINADSFQREKGLKISKLLVKFYPKEFKSERKGVSTFQVETKITSLVKEAFKSYITYIEKQTINHKTTVNGDSIKSFIKSLIVKSNGDIDWEIADEFKTPAFQKEIKKMIFPDAIDFGDIKPIEARKAELVDINKILQDIIDDKEEEVLEKAPKSN